MSFFDRFRRPKTQEVASPPASPSPADLIAFWRQTIINQQKSWVLFRHGTCVILTQPDPDLRTQAVELMREWGPVHVGSPAADFSVLTSPQHEGWVITSHHIDIMTYVGPDEVPLAERDDLMLGICGREKRDRDAEELEIIHVEDKRGAE